MQSKELEATKQHLRQLQQRKEALEDQLRARQCFILQTRNFQGFSSIRGSSGV